MFHNKPGHILLRFWHFPVVTLGPNRRIGIWLQGCSIHCAGCIAPENQPFDIAFSISLDALMNEFEPIINEASGVTISGGEPLDQMDALCNLLERLNGCGIKDILLYSGYLKENIFSKCPQLPKLIAALIDGPFIDGSITDAPWKGSENQTLTIFREEYKLNYKLWIAQTERKLQLIKKKTGRYLIGIPRQYDNCQKRIEAKEAIL